MNDRFKFRCWDKQIKKMRYGDIQLSCSGLPFTLEATSEGLKVVDIDNIEIMQSTGIKDRNGKLIYEGDIVARGEDKAVIKYDDETASFYMRWVETETFIEDCEVIGNIYENPELLEERC